MLILNPKQLILLMLYIPDDENLRQISPVSMRVYGYKRQVLLQFFVSALWVLSDVD